MVTKPDTRTLTLALAVLLSALVACKMFKKTPEEESPVASASASVTQAVAEKPVDEKPEEKKAAAPKLGDVKRFKDKEKEAEGVVKVLEADVKVYNEPDTKVEPVAELNKNIFVNRLATLDEFVLVEFPSGVGELSPGWVEAKFLGDEAAKVSQDKVKEQQAAAKVTVENKATTQTVKTEDKKDTTQTVKTETRRTPPRRSRPKTRRTPPRPPTPTPRRTTPPRRSRPKTKPKRRRPSLNR